MHSLLLGEAAEFRDAAARFLAGEVDDEAFRTFRLRRGIYGQRQPGVQMVRIKIPSGLATAEQLRAIAGVADEFGHGIGHITTRQDVQVHFVPLARVGDAMERLALAGLTTREACGNSVRNVTACPLAGHCPGQAFDVRPFGLAISRRLLRNPLGARLPRKFKIAFSCSLDDCALGDINDIGAAALAEGGRPGFRIRVGGGLGPSPQLAQTLYEFLPVEELGPVCDAILRVFDEHGNRQDRHRARMKFVLRQWGIDWFRQKVEAARAAHRPNAARDATTGGQSRDGQECPSPHPPDLWEVPAAPPPSEGSPWPVTVPQGNLSAAQLCRLAGLAQSYGDGTVCFTINQNVVLNGVRAARAATLERELRLAGFRSDPPGRLADVVTCPGAATCNLGLTRSMDLGKELAEILNREWDERARRITIRVSGCPNSCGHHHIGEIGFYGNARKLEGESAPFYQLLLGGGKRPDGFRFGKPVMAVPARLAPDVVRRILNFYKAERLGGETFPEFVDRRGVESFRRELSKLDQPRGEELFIDWGEEAKFSVKLGRGECAT